MAISCGNTGTFLATMLKSEKSKKGKTGYIFIGSVNAENAAAFVQSYLPLFNIPTDPTI
jgi:hypothetical protein